MIRFYAGPTPIHISAALMRLSVLLKKEKKTQTHVKLKGGMLGLWGEIERKMGIDMIPSPCTYI